jgi:alanine racemase
MTGSANRTIPEPATAGAVLTIDLAALRDNYLTMKALAPDAVCTAVVKGDAYGIGTVPAVKALADAGCEVFFVALVAEALDVRRAVPGATIYVLNGLPPGTAEAFALNRLRPVLGSTAEIEEWTACCGSRATALPAAIHVDTGINRLGLETGEIDRIVASPSMLGDFVPSLIMSHLACGDEPDHPMNAQQNARFAQICERFPGIPASLANSAGVINGSAFHHDLVRPGIALYGGRAVAGLANPARPVVHLAGRVMQVRTVEPGQTVGYGATWTARRRSRIAVVSVGYADGYMRLVGASEGKAGARVHLAGSFAPVVGRVSMDMITVDITDVPAPGVRRGDTVELLGRNVGVDDLAAMAGTIGYEVLTNLGSRYARVYSGA